MDGDLELPPALEFIFTPSTRPEISQAALFDELTAMEEMEERMPRFVQVVALPKKKMIKRPA